MAEIMLPVLGDAVLINLLLGVKALIEGKKETKLFLGFGCNECDATIEGIRYHCSECPDYDLCPACVDKDCHRQHRKYFQKFSPLDTIKMFLDGTMPDTQITIFKKKYSNNAVTPEYWTRFDRTKSLKEWISETSHKPEPNYAVVEISESSDTFKMIEKLLDKTWREDKFGLGRDAKGLKDLKYNKLKVVKVERIENAELFDAYVHKRASLFNKAMKIGSFKQLENVTQSSKTAVATTSNITNRSDLALDIHNDINEHYLFHGTQSIDHIATQGMDNRLNTRGMFGAGVYCAESSTKADQYADSPDQRTLGDKYMLLLRVCLGEIFVETRKEAFGWRRPPCKKCRPYKDICPDPAHNTGNTGYYDSIVNDSKLLFREFIVYEKERCYPEYIITYNRV